MLTYISTPACRESDDVDDVDTVVHGVSDGDCDGDGHGDGDGDGDDDDDDEEDDDDDDDDDVDVDDVDVETKFVELAFPEVFWTNRCFGNGGDQ